jgi:hypothetical protein
MGGKCGQERLTGLVYAIYGDDLALETTILQGLILRNRAQKRQFWVFFGLFWGCFLWW